jgi:acetoin utilization protein AcuC
VSERDIRAALIHSEEIERYSYPPECPFRPERAGMLRERLDSMGLLAGPNRFVRAPRVPGREELEQFHTARYLDTLRRAEAGDHDLQALAMGLGTVDCPVFKGMYDYAARACGATLTAAELLLAGEADVALNPSGGFHHAGPERAAGFCYMNDVVLGCLALTDAGKRVFFLDIDVHHGDGVQNAFYLRSDVMTLSFHETGRLLFPGTGFEDEVGEGEGRGYSANVPLPEGTYDEAYLRAFEALAVPLLGAFEPDVIVFEIGMDTLSGDPLAHLSLTNNVHPRIIRHVLSLGVPVLAVGGGGYHVENTVRGWALAWQALCGEDKEPEERLGLGGVLLETTDWHGGLRDRAQMPEAARKERVDSALAKTIEAVKRQVFPVHGLS